MAITPARKLFSYFVSFMLLCFAKFSYDYHHQNPLKAPELPFHSIVDSEISSPPTVLPTPEKTAAPFVVIKDGKRLSPAASPAPEKSE